MSWCANLEFRVIVPQTAGRQRPSQALDQHRDQRRLEHQLLDRLPALALVELARRSDRGGRKDRLARLRAQCLVAAGLRVARGIRETQHDPSSSQLVDLSNNPVAQRALLAGMAT